MAEGFCASKGFSRGGLKLRWSGSLAERAFWRASSSSSKQGSNPNPAKTPTPLPQAYAKDVFAKGLAASPGAAVGKIVFTAEAAEAAAKAGEHVILCRTVGLGGACLVWDALVAGAMRRRAGVHCQ
jgi:hypothetical protein